MSVRVAALPERNPVPTSPVPTSPVPTSPVPTSPVLTSPVPTSPAPPKTAPSAETPARHQKGWRQRTRSRLAGLLWGDAGMSTAEYAIGTIAAAAFAAVLYTVVTGDTVTGALTSLIERALQDSF